MCTFSAGLLAAASFFVATAAFADPSCQRNGDLMFNCTYPLARAGSAQTAVSSQFDQPKNTVLHAQPKTTIVSYRQQRDARNTKIFAQSSQAGDLVAGKMFPIHYPVTANYSYPIEFEATVNERKYYLLTLFKPLGNGNRLDETFLIDAQDGSVFDKVAMTADKSGGTRISLKWIKAHSDPENMKFALHSEDATGSDISNTHALVFDQLYGSYIQMTDQLGSATSSVNAEARPGTTFTWSGVKIQIVSASPQEIAYTVAEAGKP